MLIITTSNLNIAHFLRCYMPTAFTTIVIVPFYQCYIANAIWRSGRLVLIGQCRQARNIGRKMMPPRFPKIPEDVTTV